MSATYRHSIPTVNFLALQSVSEQLITRTSILCFVAIMLCGKASRTRYIGVLRDLKNTGVHSSVQDVVRKNVRVPEQADLMDGVPMLAVELSLAGMVLLIKTRKTKSNSQRVIVK